MSKLGLSGARGAFLAIVTAALATSCAAAPVRPAYVHEIRVSDARSIADVERVLAREAWIGRERGCSLFWGESPHIYWDVQPVVIRWGEGEALRGFVLCGEAREAALRDPRIGQRVDAVFVHGELALLSPAGLIPFDAHPMSDEGDGETSVLLRFDPSRSDDFWSAYEALEALRAAEDDALLGRWDIEPPTMLARR